MKTTKLFFTSNKVRLISDYSKSNVRKILSHYWVILFLLMMSFSFSFASCSKDSEEENKEEENDYLQPRNTEEMTEKIMAYFFDENKVMKCNRIPEFATVEWAATVSDPLTCLNVFNDIAGKVYPSKDNYQYTYIPLDNKSRIDIIGGLQYDTFKNYAIMRISIPSMSDLIFIHIVHPDYFIGYHIDKPQFYLEYKEK